MKFIKTIKMVRIQAFLSSNPRLKSWAAKQQDSYT